MGTTATLPVGRTVRRPDPVPRPVWERHALFREPVYAPGLTLLEEDDDPDDEAV